MTTSPTRDYQAHGLRYKIHVHVAKTKTPFPMELYHKPPKKQIHGFSKNMKTSPARDYQAHGLRYEIHVHVAETENAVSVNFCGGV